MSFSLWRRFGFDDHSVLNGVVELLLNLFKVAVQPLHFTLKNKKYKPSRCNNSSN